MASSYTSPLKARWSFLQDDKWKKDCKLRHCYLCGFKVSLIEGHVFRCKNKNCLAAFVPYIDKSTDTFYVLHDPRWMVAKGGFQKKDAKMDYFLEMIEEVEKDYHVKITDDGDYSFIISGTKYVFNPFKKYSVRVGNRTMPGKGMNVLIRLVKMIKKNRRKTERCTHE